MGIGYDDYQRGLRENMVLVGYNPDADSGAWEDVCEQGAYNRPAAADTVSLASSSTADDVGSTGAVEVTVVGLDDDGDVISEAVAMDGQTAVTTTAEFAAILDMFVSDVGSGGTNAGDIYVYDDADTLSTGVPVTAGTIYGKIAVGRHAMRAAHFEVPAGHEFTIQDLSITPGTSTTTLQAELVVTSAAGAITVWPIPLVVHGQYTHVPFLPFTLSAGEQVNVRVLASADNCVVSALLAGALNRL